MEVSSPNKEPHILDVDCRVKERELGGGPVFSCEAKSDTDQILVEGSSVSAAVGNLLKVLPGGERNAFKVNGPKFFGLRCNEIVK